MHTHFIMEYKTHKYLLCWWPDQHFDYDWALNLVRKKWSDLARFFCFFCTHEAIFPVYWGVCICTLVMECVFSPPAWWCVYSQALQGSGIFMPFSVMRVFSCMHDCVCIFCSFDGVCILKLSWSCFDAKELSIFTASYEEIKVQICKKKSYLRWIELATLRLVASCSTIEPQKLRNFKKFQLAWNLFK